MSTDSVEGENSPPQEPRRSFIQRIPSLLMSLGIVLGYGTFGGMIGRFLFPSAKKKQTPQYVANLNEFVVGDSMTYVSPAGERVVLTRIGEENSADAFIALSSVCPHLGCAVHWEGQNDRFFCPCHNGAFDSQGNPLSGPPKESHQSLPRYELSVENGLLFIQASTEALVKVNSTDTRKLV